MNNDKAEQFLLKALINYKELLWTDDVSVFVLYDLSVFWFTYFFLKGFQLNTGKHLDYSFMATGNRSYISLQKDFLNWWLDFVHFLHK